MHVLSHIRLPAEQSHRKLSSQDENTNVPCARELTLPASPSATLFHQPCVVPGHASRGQPGTAGGCALKGGSAFPHTYVSAEGEKKVRANGHSAVADSRGWWERFRNMMSPSKGCLLSAASQSSVEPYLHALPLLCPPLPIPLLPRLRLTAFPRCQSIHSEYRVPLYL